MDKKIMEGDAKIAIFMNVMPVKPMNGELDLNCCRWVDSNQVNTLPSWIVHPIMTNNLCYHSSWDWLKPVIDKIWKMYEDADLNYKSICDLTIFATIDKAFEAVIEFIDWYNNHVSEPLKDK